MISKKDVKILRKMLDAATEPGDALSFDELCPCGSGKNTKNAVCNRKWLCQFTEGKEL